MKKLFIATICSLSLVLVGCLGAHKFDATNEGTVKESVKEITNNLPPEKQEEFKKALIFFTMGGEDGLKSMVAAAMSGNSETSKEVIFASNLAVLDGLTGEQILTKYKKAKEEARIKREKEEAEREKRQAEREAVTKLRTEARDLLKSNKFEKALAKYEAMSEYSSGIEAAEEGIQSTKIAMDKFAEKMNYTDKIEITEFVAKRIDTYSEKGVPAVRIGLKNKGDRTLEKVKVVVYFKDNNGNVIYEEDFHPVLVTDYSYGRNSKPLKPGYISEMEQGKYYTIESQLSAWAEGEAFAKVTDLSFAD